MDTSTGSWLMPIGGAAAGALIAMMAFPPSGVALLLGAGVGAGAAILIAKSG